MTPDGTTGRCPHCRAEARAERSAVLRWRCAVCGGPIVPVEGSAPRSNAELASLVAAQRMRAMALGWVAAAVVLGAMATMALGVAMLVWLASHVAGFVFAALAGAAATLSVGAARRAGKRNAGARAKLEDAWERVADEVLRAQGAELTAAQLARAMRTDEAHAETLLARLSVSGRARVDVRDDAELAYRVHEDAAAETPQDAGPDGSRARVP